MWLGGQLNGYVRIPKAHPFYQKGYDDIPIDCHGGLTYAGELEYDDDFYIGFDTAHFGDYMPFMHMSLGKEGIISENPEERYKDIDYVRKECKRIVDQLTKQ